MKKIALIIISSIFIFKCTPEFAQSFKNINDASKFTNTLIEKGLLEEALDVYFDYIIPKIPNNHGTWHNIGHVYRLLGQPIKSIKAYEKALSIDPENEYTNFGLSKAYLAAGKFKKGWKKFEYRYKDIKKFKQKKIDPKNLNGKTVVILSEWGLGDTMQFIRYAKLIKSNGATVICESPKPLIPLFSQCKYIDRVVPRGCQQLPPHDIKIPILSLPLIFNTTVETIPAPIPYLYAKPELIKFWKNKIKNDKNFKVGICWQSKPGIFLEEQPRTKRSICLEKFAPLSKIDGVSFYSLQQVNGLNQLHNLPQEFEVIHFDGNFDKSNGRFMDTAAIIKNLDLIISVDTSIVHLAGALGKEVWILIPHTAEWRWMFKRNDSPWYPKSRLFRQSKPGDWKSVIENIKNNLSEKIKQR